jgi:hypothetical protein
LRIADCGLSTAFRETPAAYGLLPPACCPLPSVLCSFSVASVCSVVQRSSFCDLVLLGALCVPFGVAQGRAWREAVPALRLPSSGGRSWRVRRGNPRCVGGDGVFGRKIQTARPRRRDPAVTRAGGPENVVFGAGGFAGGIWRSELAGLKTRFCARGVHTHWQSEAAPVKTRFLLAGCPWPVAI